MLKISLSSFVILLSGSTSIPAHTLMYSLCSPLISSIFFFFFFFSLKENPACVRASLPYVSACRTKLIPAAAAASVAAATVIDVDSEEGRRITKEEEEGSK